MLRDWNNGQFHSSDTQTTDKSWETGIEKFRRRDEQENAEFDANIAQEVTKILDENVIGVKETLAKSRDSNKLGRPTKFSLKSAKPFFPKKMKVKPEAPAPGPVVNDENSGARFNINSK